MLHKTPACHAALGIIRRLREAGFEAYLAGGAVRNLLMGLEPKDYDVATSARPEQVAALFTRTLLIGASFGVAVVLEHHAQTEVATFRRDGRYEDFRHPVQVEYAGAREDACRRDFTINALFYDPDEERVLDWVGGQEDLQARRLRTVGNPDERFQEDALRLLRAVRFARRFDLAIEPATAAAIRRHAPLIEHISPERICEELAAILTGPHAGDALQQLLQMGLLQVILPEVARMNGVAQPPQFHPEGDVFRHTVLCLNALKPSPNPALAFGVLLHDVGKPPTFSVSDRIHFNEHAPVGAEMADEICRRLRFSNEQRARICGLVADHMRFLEARRMKRSTLRRFFSKEFFEDDLELHRVDCASSHRNLENYFFCLGQLEVLRAEGQTAAPAPLVNGDDLIALGQTPSPQFKQWLHAVYDLQLEGQVATREQALEALKRLCRAEGTP